MAWLDDKGIIRVNRGYRYQYSSALGPFVVSASLFFLSDQQRVYPS